MHIFLSVIVCIYAQIVAIIQGAEQNTQVRLINGDSRLTGRLEIYLNGQWVTVRHRYYSTYQFTDNDARVVCRMLGFGENGMAYIFPDGPTLFGEGTGDVLYETMQCRGNETDLSQCGTTATSSWTISSSGPHNVDVAMSCEKTKLRLVDGDSVQSGRVEVFMKGQWSSICGDNFDNNDAQAICKMLGYSDTGISQAFTASHFGQGSGDIIISNLRCTGTESDIKYCTPTWSYNRCDHRNEAGVNCGPDINQIYVAEGTPVRLVNGPNNSSGRVEIYHAGHWGTICGSYFDNYDVMVICRMYGMYNPNAFGYSFAFYGEGLGNIIIRNLDCDGSEVDIGQCKANTWSSSTDYNSCGSSNEVGVNCDGKTPMRLVDGVSEQSGRVEVYHNGNWGTVSDSSFDNHDLAVICHMLGYQYTSKSFFVPRAFYGQGIGEVVVSNLQCKGAEDDIGHCTATWWPSTSRLNHDTDVGVNCDGIIPIKLVGGNTNASGRVEIYHDGYYGTLCSDGFDRLDLVVVCRMLGFENIPRGAYWYSATRYGQGLGEIVTSHLQCNGAEHSIGQCSARWPAYSNCDHSDDVYVNCDGAPENIRLVDGPSRYSGRVEIFLYGRWATICDYSFDRADAVVICKMLNFPHPEMAIAHTGAHYGAANDTVPIAFTSLNCNGIEQNLGQCNPTWSSSSCRHSNDIGVDCCPNCQDPVIG